MYTNCMHIFDADLSEYTYDYADDVNRYMQFLKTCPGKLHRQGASVSGTERVDARLVATLKGSAVDSVNKNTIGKRLTNLLGFNVDIRWWEHYCSTENPDLGSTCAQAGTALSQPIERFPAISRNMATSLSGSTSTTSTSLLQAIASTASVQLGFIGAGSISLYPTLAQ